MPISLNVAQQSWLPRRPSVSQPSPNHLPRHPQPTAKGPPLDGADSSPSEFGAKFVHNVDSIVPQSSGPSLSSSVHDSSSYSVPHSHLQQFSSLPSRHRSSLLSAASDAFGFRKKIGSVRRKSNLHSLSHTNNAVPEVIEINAYNNTTVTSTIGGTTAHRDYEHEERERLRDVAAQSIGLDPELLHDSCKSGSRSSLDFPPSLLQSTRIPPFPATLTMLRPFTELSSTLFKFTPPSSLLVYALAKQWKQRIIVLTSYPPSQKTYVHLFKSSSKDDKEVERLEVTENSVVFVAEEEVGGRGNVVKFAGKDISTKRSATNGEDGVLTMWFLQITDPAESQHWIAAIKNAVLTQKVVRAGLEIPTQTTGGNEPKGDIDVMLSMHLQGLISTKNGTTFSFPSPPARVSPSPPPSLHSLKINVPSSPSPPTALKGIFTGARPRSPSVEGSPTPAHPHGHAEDSFGVAGNSLLTMLRTKSSAESNSSSPVALPHASGEGSPAPSLRSARGPIIITASDLKISKERDAPELSGAILEVSSSSTPPGSNTPPTPSLTPQGALTLSLQPPPRKCKHIVAPVPATFLPEPPEMYKQVTGNRSVVGNFGISSGSSGNATQRDTSPVSPGSSSVSGGWSGSFSQISGFEVQVPCTDEAHGCNQSDEVSPISSGNKNVDSLSSPSIVPSDRPVIPRRRSRQGVLLPKQLTPPSGPPPSIPLLSESDCRTSLESSISITASYATDHSPGGSSLNSHSQVRPSSRSGSSLSPTFWKRASGSSTHSANSTNTSDSRSRSQVAISFSGESFRSSSSPAVGRGASSRPMSLLVPTSSSVRHTGTTKRRSMPPPRPAPKFAPPPAPTIQESTSERAPLSAPQKLFRSSIAQRALRNSLTSPKPPPSSALPPRPDEAVFAPGHHRSSSTGTTDIHSISAPSSRPASALSKNSNPVEPPPPGTLSIRQRLRILSTPPTSPSLARSPSFLTSSFQVSTLDLSDDNDDDDDLPTPSFHSPQPIGLGEQHMSINYPSFLQLSTPVTPTASKPSFRNPFRSVSPLSGTTRDFGTSSPELDRDFVALSPPPPRRCSKPYAPITRRPEKLEVDGTRSAQVEGSELVTLAHGESVVSLGLSTP